MKPKYSHPIFQVVFGLELGPTNQEDNFALDNIVISIQIDTLQGGRLGGWVGWLDQADNIATSASS